jgi:hypothetical protein
VVEIEKGNKSVFLQGKNQHQLFDYGRKAISFSKLSPNQTKLLRECSYTTQDELSQAMKALQVLMASLVEAHKKPSAGKKNQIPRFIREATAELSKTRQLSLKGFLGAITR